MTIAPVAVSALGALAVAGLARRLLDAAKDLSTSRRHLGRLDQALIPIRVETRATRASIDRIEHR